MASTAAHRSTGWAVGIIAAVVASRSVVDPYHVWTIATILAGHVGGTAPDWLENAWWSRGRGRQLWIAHRSWTHWGLAWLGLLMLCYCNLRRTPLAAPLLGFAAGGIMHLLADWPNPLGVPWFLTRRYSLRWWNSGRCDYVIIFAAWGVALGIADHFWWRGQLYRHISAFLTSIASGLSHLHLAALSH